jgi:hypothetical protein
MKFRGGDAEVSERRLCASSDCLKPLEGRQRKWCNETCRMREFQRRWTAQHGEPYTARFREQRRQAGRDAIAAGKGPRSRTSGAAQAADRRRRARLAEQHVEAFTRREIFERDGWICGICGQDVDPSLRFPDPGSASIDHVIPVGLHGEHSPANVRCAHLACNVRRGTRTDEEYFASSSAS